MQKEKDEETTPIVSYLKDGTLPNGNKVVRKLKVQVARFVLIKDVLYKRGLSCSYLRCLSPKEANYVMREVYEGVCGNHSGSRSLVHKLIWAGYYWLTMQKDAHAYVKAYEKCQRRAHPNDSPMAFHSMGIGYHEPISNSNEIAKVPSGRHRLLHQIGRS
ncbi:hypothetical protein ACB092_02G223100 [Castanea dentata]